MATVVNTGSLMACSYGQLPCPFIATPRKVSALTTVGTIRDTTPLNIPTFGLCKSMMNPVVIAATVSHLGVLTPMPCIPIVLSPWICKSKVMIKNDPILSKDAKAKCIWGGQITFKMCAQLNVMKK